MELQSWLAGGSFALCWALRQCISARPSASAGADAELTREPRDLQTDFVSPPQSTRPYVLWMWMGCNVSKDGITRDLEAMQAAGIGGATIFSLADTVTPWSGVIHNSPTPDIVAFTEPWWAIDPPCLRRGQATRIGVDPPQLCRL